MTFVSTVISALRRNDEGQDLLEYGLLMSLIAITALWMSAAIVAR